MKFKVGQKVYFYQSTGEYRGDIVEGTITKAIKDLKTGEVIYTVNVAVDCTFGWLFGERGRELTGEYLYASKAKIEKEYKEEIVYNNLHNKIDELQRTLNQVYNELTKDEHKGLEGLTLNINGDKAFSTLQVNADDINIEGIGSLKDELNKLKKEVSKIKKEIKPKTKKPVIKESKEKQG